MRRCAKRRASSALQVSTCIAAMAMTLLWNERRAAPVVGR